MKTSFKAFSVDSLNPGLLQLWVVCTYMFEEVIFSYNYVQKSQCSLEAIFDSIILCSFDFVSEPVQPQDNYSVGENTFLLLNICGSFSILLS